MAPRNNEVLMHSLEPLRRFLDCEGVTELVINEPGEVGVESRDGWNWHAVPEMTFHTLMSIAVGAASWTSQNINQQNPICSTVLPTGERVQALLPPAVPDGTVSLTIRKPSSKSFTMDDFDKQGLFSETRISTPELSDVDQQLVELRDKKNFADFFKLAVASRKNIVISGSTGSGKTAFSKGLIQLIPEHERILTIEDTRELDVPQRNKVHMMYAKDAKGASKISAKELLESALRMRPDRILLQELRDGTAFYYLRNVNSGHPGSITTVHANSPALAFEQLTLLVKESEGGRDLARDDIRELLHGLVDIVAQMKKINGKFLMTEVYYDPHRGI